MSSISRLELERIVKLQLSQVHKEFYGVGPGAISTGVMRNLISFQLQRCLTPLERQLAMGNNLDIVHEMRQKMLDRLKGIPELKTVLGANLLESMGKILPDLDVLYGFFIYDRDLPVVY